MPSCVRCADHWGRGVRVGVCPACWAEIRRKAKELHADSALRCVRAQRLQGEAWVRLARLWATRQGITEWRTRFERPPELRAGELAGLRILVVDDDPDVRESMRSLLEELGGRVTVARDGHEALELAARERLDVVLCDLRMPGLDGFEFLRRFRQDPRQAHVPVVAVSAMVGVRDGQPPLDDGFAGHLDKPFGLEDLIAALSTARRAA